MIYKAVISVIISFVTTLIFGVVGIPLLKKIKIGQPILHYVETHKNKNGTPTMGGIFFILSLAVNYFILGEKGMLSNTVLVVCLAFFVVGLLDDFLKVKSHDNQGLKAYQKIIFQVIISLFTGFFAYKNNLTTLNIPYVNKSVELGAFIIPFSALTLVGATNAVNLTDGVDGLSSSVSVTYLFFFFVLLYMQNTSFGAVIKSQELNSLFFLIGLLFGGLLAFLIFNVSKASVFMGDTGSLAIGGYIGALSIVTNNELFLLVLGFMFVVSIISVVIQVIYYKKTKKRVFLMSPFHHHLQLKGLQESKISYIYSVITCIIGLTIIISYL